MIPREVTLYNTNDNFDITSISNRRFMYNNKTSEVVFGSNNISSSSHNAEWKDSGAKGISGDCVRGWIGFGGRYKNGIIHFAPPITGSDFIEGFDCLKMFLKHGATDKTKVRSFLTMDEKTIKEIFNKKASIMASGIIKLSDEQTKRGIKQLWEHYKHNIDMFSQKVGDLVKKNQLSMSADRGWLLNFMNKLTGEDWVLDRSGFVASNKSKIINLVMGKNV